MRSVWGLSGGRSVRFVRGAVGAVCLGVDVRGLCGVCPGVGLCGLEVSRGELSRHRRTAVTPLPRRPRAAVASPSRLMPPLPPADLARRDGSPQRVAAKALSQRAARGAPRSRRPSGGATAAPRGRDRRRLTTTLPTTTLLVRLSRTASAVRCSAFGSTAAPTLPTTGGPFSSTTAASRYLPPPTLLPKGHHKTKVITTTTRFDSSHIITVSIA